MVHSLFLSPNPVLAPVLCLVKPLSIIYQLENAEEFTSDVFKPATRSSENSLFSSKRSQQILDDGRNHDSFFSNSTRHLKALIFLDVLIQRDAEPCMSSPEARTVHFHLRCFTPPRHSNKNTPAVNTLSPSSSSVSVALGSHCSSRVELHHFFVYPASCCPVGCKVSLVLVVCLHTHTVTHTHTAPQMRALPLSLLSCVCLLRLLSSCTAFEFGQFSRCAQSSLTAPGRRLKGGESERQFQSERKKERKREEGVRERFVVASVAVSSALWIGGEWREGGSDGGRDGGSQSFITSVLFMLLTRV